MKEALNRNKITRRRCDNGEGNLVGPFHPIFTDNNIIIDDLARYDPISPLAVSANPYPDHLIPPGINVEPNIRRRVDTNTVDIPERPLTPPPIPSSNISILSTTPPIPIPPPNMESGNDNRHTVTENIPDNKWEDGHNFFHNNKETPLNEINIWTNYNDDEYIYKYFVSKDGTERTVQINKNTGEKRTVYKSNFRFKPVC
tara:strand:- start:140 stop:739 length:600 start_codon:yes stop_codon:yes gene_type:complete